MKLLVLRAGDASPTVAARRGEFFSWIRREAAPVGACEWSEHDARVLSVPLPSPDAADGFVITGSSSSVTERAEWMLRLEALVRELVARRRPLFGVCFGHQLVGQALGGEVARNPRGREIGTVEVRRLDAGNEDVLLDRLPSSFTVNASHVDSVVKLPSDARVLAETMLEPHAAFSVGETTKCVQFHPEFDGDSMRGYIDARAHLIDAEGQDSRAIVGRSVDTPHGAETLRNFLRHVVAPSLRSR